MDHIVEPTEEEIISEASFIEMKTYVKYCLYFGYGEKEIIDALKKVGWTGNEISRAFKSVKPVRTKPLEAPVPGPMQKKPAAKETLPPIPSYKAPPIKRFLVPKGKEIEPPKPSS